MKKTDRVIVVTLLTKVIEGLIREFPFFDERGNLLDSSRFADERYETNGSGRHSRRKGGASHLRGQTPSQQRKKKGTGTVLIALSRHYP